MEANELRIGNFVQYIQGNKIITTTVSCLCETFAELKHYNDDVIHSSSIDYCMIVPTPLTEEWILKFGFSLMPESEYTFNTYEKEGFQLWNKKGDFSENLYLSNRDSIEVKSIHQLQNLFFALKGKELTLK